MRRSNKSKEDDLWLAALGRHIEGLIKKRGYDSAYDFWINHEEAGDTISRAALNYIVAGKSDPKASTLRALAKLLGLKPAKLLDFE